MEWFFKLTPNIVDEAEREFARMELEQLFGKNVQPILNFFDELQKYPLILFTSPNIRIQDFMLHELPYGEIQGYKGISEDLTLIEKLIKRLTFTREIYLITSSQNINRIEKALARLKGKTYHYFVREGFACFRFIVYQYFWENSEYVLKLSYSQKDIENKTSELFSHPIKNIYRIPAPTSLKVGRKLQDYLSLRDFPTWYLTHYFYPYKGKFFPQMVRALLNYIIPEDNGFVLDSFMGSGTLLMEAAFLELNGIGIDINPLCVLVSKGKHQSLLIDPLKLDAEIKSYFETIDNIRNWCLLFPPKHQALDDIFIKTLSLRLKQLSKSSITQILGCKEALSSVNDENIKSFLMLCLAGSISDITRRISVDFIEAFKKRISDSYLLIYLFSKINEILNVNLGKVEVYQGDARRLPLEDESIDGIITSPPYSIALDYIRNDYPQMLLLGLADNLETLEEQMIGNPRYAEGVIHHTKISIANKIIDELLLNGREALALQLSKFYNDMDIALKEMHRVLKGGRKCAIIIGNNIFKIKDRMLEIPNDIIILEQAKMIGFEVDKVLIRRLFKNLKGAFDKEIILIFKKR